MRLMFRTTSTRFQEHFTSLLLCSTKKIGENRVRCANSMLRRKKNATLLSSLFDHVILFVDFRQQLIATQKYVRRMFSTISIRQTTLARHQHGDCFAIADRVNAVAVHHHFSSTYVAVWCIVVGGGGDCDTAPSIFGAYEQANRGYYGGRRR